ncbi:MAG: MFS transporter [Thermomicrobiales bacterium]
MSPLDPAMSGLDPQRRRSLIAALMAVFVGALDLTVIATILPRMVSDLEINTADIDRYVWIVNGYLLAYIVAIPVVGRVSDLVGRRAAFLGALSAFAIGSLVCALGHSLGPLIAGRAIQGAGGGALLPITMALVGDLVPRERRAGALGLVGAIETLGWVLGPLWGALIIGLVPGQDPWRWVFWVNIPLALLAAAAVWRMPMIGPATPTELRARNWFQQLDPVGVLLLAASLVMLNLGLSAGGEVGGGSGSGSRALGGTENPLAEWSGWLLAGSALSGAAFAFWERRSAHPHLPTTHIRRPWFSPALATNFVTGAALIVAMVDIPVVVTLLVQPDQVSSVTALMMAPFTVLMAALSLGGGMLVARRGGRWVAMVGLLLAAIGYALLWFGIGKGSIFGMLPGLAVAGAGFGMVVAPISAAAIDAVAPEDRGIAAALTLVARLLGMTVSISALTALGVHRLQSLVSTLEPIVQVAGESTAQFFTRQTEFLYERVIPLTVQVVRETFLIAGIIALLAILPARLLSREPASTDREPDGRQ